MPSVGRLHGLLPPAAPVGFLDAAHPDRVESSRRAVVHLVGRSTGDGPRGTRRTGPVRALAADACVAGVPVLAIRGVGPGIPRRILVDTTNCVVRAGNTGRSAAAGRAAVQCDRVGVRGSPARGCPGTDRRTSPLCREVCRLPLPRVPDNDTRHQAILRTDAHLCRSRRCSSKVRR